MTLEKAMLVRRAHARRIVALAGACALTQLACGAGAARPLSDPPSAPICRDGKSTCRSSKRYPKTVDERRKQRRKAQRNALLASVVAIPVGVALTAAALYGDSPPPEGDTVLDRAEDGAKNAGGRVLLGAGGLAATVGGLGLLGLGIFDRFFPDPLIIGVGCKATLVDPMGPPTGVAQLDAHLRSNLAWLRPESEIGLGIAHWVSPRWRLRYSLSPALGLPLGKQERGHAALSLGLQADWNPGLRRDFGRSLGNALSLYLAPRLLKVADDPLSGRPLGDSIGAVGWRAGIGWSTVRGTMTLGASQIIGHDKYPLAEVSISVSLPSL